MTMGRKQQTRTIKIFEVLKAIGALITNGPDSAIGTNQVRYAVNAGDVVWCGECQASTKSHTTKGGLSPTLQWCEIW